MKTKNLLPILLLAVSMVSCTTYYQVKTQVFPDGSARREVYAFGDSAFMAGNWAQNPFMFSLDSGWTVTRFDSVRMHNYFGEKEKINVCASREQASVDLFSEQVRPKNPMFRPLVTPRETLTKHFRWFYTYYTYNGVYPELTEKGPVPLKNYLNESEQKLWFQGDDTAYRGMNGLEMKEVLDRLEGQFVQWYNRSLYELSIEVMRPFIADLKQGDYLSRLNAAKDSLYQAYRPQNDDPDFSPALVCQLLDTHFHTDCFSLLYKEKQQEVDKKFDEETRSVELFGVVIQYELNMPGQMLSANTTFREDGHWVWKVDAYRLLAGEYLLTAESRVPNIWAFILTGLLILLGIGYWIKKR